MTATVAGVAPAGDADGDEGDEGEAALGAEFEQPATNRTAAVPITRRRIPSLYTGGESLVP